jgi:hypothetical protein
MTLGRALDIMVIKWLNNNRNILNRLQDCHLMVNSLYSLFLTLSRVSSREILLARR